MSKRFGIVLFVNEPQEFARACHVAAFAYVDEIVFGADNEAFEPADVQTIVFRDGTAGRGILCDFPIAGYVLGCRSATTTHDIYQSLVDKFFYLCSHRCGRFVIFAQPIGQSGIGVSTDVIGGDRCPTDVDRVSFLLLRTNSSNLPREFRHGETAVRKASSVCPDSVRPLSVTVIREHDGSSRPVAFIDSCAAKRAALALSVSKMVSMSRRSTPPSIKAVICSR